MSAKVTREHRELAFACIWADTPMRNEREWIENGTPTKGGRLSLTAQAIADAEARGAASAAALSEAEVAIVEAATTLHEYWTKVEGMGFDGIKRKSEETTRLSAELERRTLELLALRAAKKGGE